MFSTAVLTVTVATALALALALAQPCFAQECPNERSAKNGFIVERSERQKSDVFHGEQGIVRTIMRYDGTTLLETTLYEGIFDLDRLDRGRRIKYEPGVDLKSLFPLAPGKRVKAKFASEADGRPGRLEVELVVKKSEDMFIGPCKYAVLRIERSESRDAGPMRFAWTELYSAMLKLVLAREYKEQNGRTETIKYDRIYPIKN